VIDPVFCVKEYWLDYPRRDRVKINKCGLTRDEKKELLAGHTIVKPGRGRTYKQYFVPIKYDNIVD
jgi:hypothetical protein